MPDLTPFARHRDARHLDAYWDAVIESAPVDPIPPDPVDRADALTVRRTQALATAPEPDAAFGERLLAELLGAIPATGTVATGDPYLASGPLVPPVPLPAPDAHPRSRPPRWIPILNVAAAILLIVLLASGAWIARDRLAFLDQDSDPTALAVINFDPNNIALEWQTGSAAGFSPAICDVAVSEEGLVYVVDCLENNIKVFDDDGNLVDTWGSYGIAPGQFRFGTPERNQGGIDLDAEGNVYVFDTGNDRVQKFSPDHEFIREWGTKGNGVGEFRDPLGAVDRENGRVYVADSSNSRIQVFDLDGTYLDQWGERGDLNGQFHRPQAIAIGADGTVNVADPDARRIQHFSPNGTYLEHIGTPDELGNVTGVAVDNAGNLYAASPSRGAVLVYGPDGVLLGAITEVSGAGALDTPRQVLLDSGSDLYVLTGDRVLKLGLG